MIKLEELRHPCVVPGYVYGISEKDAACKLTNTYDKVLPPTLYPMIPIWAERIRASWSSQVPTWAVNQHCFDKRVFPSLWRSLAATYPHDRVRLLPATVSIPELAPMITSWPVSPRSWSNSKKLQRSYTRQRRARWLFWMNWAEAHQRMTDTLSHTLCCIISRHMLVA